MEFCLKWSIIPMKVINNVEQEKVKGSWSKDDKKKVLVDKKAKNILQSTLVMDEFIHVYHCKIEIFICDTLEGTHEGTIEVKRPKLNTLSRAYHMQNKFLWIS